MAVTQDAERPQEPSHAERGNDAPAGQLQPEHSGELIRLERLLDGTAGGFALILAGYNQPLYRNRLIGHLRSSRTAAGPAVLDAGSLDGLLQLEDWLESHGTDGSPLHLVGLERWLAHDETNQAGLERLRGFNRHRDHLAKLCRRPLLLWLLQHQLGEFAREAPDAWEWRTGVLDFSLRLKPSGLELPQPLDQLRADREQRLARIAELARFLQEHHGRLTDQERLVLWGELGDLNQAMGEWDAALEAYAQADAACRLLDDRLDAARLLAKSAEIRWQRGDPDTALAELRRAQAVFETLGDERSRAVALGQIADILQARGDLDQALRIRWEEEIPVYERLGDVRARAVALGQIAAILQARGDLDQAMRIRREEQIPVYERLGDVRARAVALGQIAAILQARGDLDQAISTLQEKVVPAFERLGDVRARAVALGKIADILQARGDLDEAMRIRREEEIPVYERLGDVRSRAVALGQIADILQARGDLDQALRIRREEEIPVYERLGDVRSRAVTLGKIADVLEARGDLDQAIRIRRDEQIPVFERLGDVRSLLVARTKLALLLLESSPPKREEAERLLCLALAEARRLRLPKAGQIEAIMQRHGFIIPQPS